VHHASIDRVLLAPEAKGADKQDEHAETDKDDRERYAQEVKAKGGRWGRRVLEAEELRGYDAGHGEGEGGAEVAQEGAFQRWIWRSIGVLARIAISRRRAQYLDGLCAPQNQL
jgi:hypothetical protein